MKNPPRAHWLYSYALVFLIACCLPCVLSLPWEDIAGTMAHEMSHCIHHNHGKEFFLLMEEILEQHAVLQANSLGSSRSIFTPVNAHVVQRDIGNNSNTAGMDPTTGGFPTGSGQKLGGSQQGKSRLLDGGGVKLGGQKLGGESHRSLREAVARAAEARRRQLDQVRRMMERTKEPCIIEIPDDDDYDYDELVEAAGSTDRDKATVKTEHHDKPQQATSMTARKQFEAHVNQKQSKPGEKPHSGVPISQDRKRPAAVTKVPTLTKKPAKDAHPRPKPSKISAASDIIDLTDDNLPTPSTTGTATGEKPREWNCGSCTFINKSMALACEMCSAERT
jgi:hypothetical protein